jgi:hypothetical protein
MRFLLKILTNLFSRFNKKKASETSNLNYKRILEEEEETLQQIISWQSRINQEGQNASPRLR